MLKKIINNYIKEIKINFSSPKSILNESYGEVLNSETINYKTQKPEKGGLFCETIFGPIKNFECSCGKYKNIKFKGVICDRCGVEIIDKSVRRYRLGHIKLSVPIVHIWSFKCLPNKISYLIGKSSKNVESIIYYNKYVILNLGKFNKIKINNKYYYKYDLINEEIYFKIKDYIYKINKKNKKKIIIKTGGIAIYYILKKIDLKKTFNFLKKKIIKEKNNKKKKKIFKRLSIFQMFLKSKNNNKPEYMVLKNLPIIPPDLRPLIQLDVGKYASSDLNELYKKVIIRNNRLKKLLKVKAPEIILINEKRMLQESIDNLFDNSKNNLFIKKDNKKKLKSLSDSLKGKFGRFRHNLLGKRVDYSARSVIVVEPNLKLYQCGLPRGIAIELFKPFLISKLLNLNIVNTIKGAELIIKKKKRIIWEILNEIVKNHPILLNRAPTLHRFSIQAFQPILIKSKSIKLHPLVCSAFNADFDGDQMAVHLPLSNEAILEAQFLMLSSNNILNISNGNPIILPSQDIILGLYYLTIMNKNKKNYKIYSSIKEVIIIYNLKLLKIHDNIKLKFKNKIISTTVGRTLFNNIIPKYKNFNFFNKTIKKKNIKYIILKVFKYSTILQTTKFLDKLKFLGLSYAYKGGLSFNIQDIIINKEKKKIINLNQKKINNLYKYYNLGFITNKYKKDKIIDIWSKSNNILSDLIIKKMMKNKFNSIYMMLDSEARSTIVQIRQITGLRGLIVKPKKYNKSISSNIQLNEKNNSDILETPIISNFLEGLSVLEYFISTHGSRKGLADTALKTADAGYLTRRLVDVVQNIIIKKYDCKTLNGIKIYSKNLKFSNSDLLGRISLFNIRYKNKIILKKNKIINYDIIKKINKKKINYIYIRSPFTCNIINGVCSKCYGTNLSNSKLIKIGETVGIIAAQSIGEPGTQLTLRTFHLGGSAGNISKKDKLISNYKGRIKIKYLKYIKNKNRYIVISRFTKLYIKNKNKNIYKKNIPYGSILFIKKNKKIKKGDLIYKFDPYNIILISEYNGIIKYNNFKININYKIKKNKNSFFKEIKIIESKEKLPSLFILNKNKKKIKEYNLPIGAILNVKNKEKIKKGKILFKKPRIYYKNQDITGGLPKLSELFEARLPYNRSILSEISGFIKIKNKKTYNIIYIKSLKFKKTFKYIIKKKNNTQQILVQNNDYIKSGTPLTEGNISLKDLLYIKGIRYLQTYLIKKIKNVYITQGVEINNKHFEIIINQMLIRVKIIYKGDTNLVVGNIITKDKFFKKNNKIKNMVKIIENYKKFNKGDLINKYIIKIKNKYLKFLKKKIIKTKKIKFAIGIPILLGITKSALYNNSFISAASFQETTKILSESAISAKKDKLLGLKENIIIGNKIPAGTGLRKYNNIKIKYDKSYN